MIKKQVNPCALTSHRVVDLNITPVYWYLTMSDQQIIDQINNDIAKLTSYGVRDVAIPSEGYAFLSWSNGARVWRIYPNYVQNNLHYSTSEDATHWKCDANQLIVPFSEETVTLLLDKLDTLPLDKGSFENKLKRYEI